MSKQLKQLVILGVSLVILLGSLLALILTAPKKNANPDGTESGSVHDDSVVLIDTDKTPLSMYVKNQITDFTLMKGDDGEFYFKELPGFNMDDGFLKNLWKDATYMGANKEITAAEGQQMPSDEDMGLANPQAKVLVTYTDGSTVGYTVGNALTGDNKVYYLRMDGSENVYAVTLHTFYFKSREDCFDDEIISYPRDEAGNYLDQNIDNIVLTGTNYPQKVCINKNDDVKNATSIFYGSEYVITAPEKTVPNSTAVADLAYQLKQVIVNRLVCYNPTPQQLAQYGLDNPRAVVSFTCNDQPTTVLRAGNIDGSYTYIMMDGVNAVLSLQTSYCANWASYSYEQLRDASLFPRTLASFKKITVTSPATGERYVFNVSSSSKGEGSGFDYLVTCNGKSVDYKNYQNYISTMTLTKAVEFEKTGAAENPSLIIDIEYFDAFSSEKERITFTPVGTRRFLCKVTERAAPWFPPPTPTSSSPTQKN